LQDIVTSLVAAVACAFMPDRYMGQYLTSK
jgi:hypothetical protein